MHTPEVVPQRPATPPVERVSLYTYALWPLAAPVDQLLLLGLAHPQLVKWIVDDHCLPVLRRVEEWELSGASAAAGAASSDEARRRRTIKRTRRRRLTSARASLEPALAALPACTIERCVKGARAPPDHLMRRVNSRLDQLLGQLGVRAQIERFGAAVRRRPDAGRHLNTYTDNRLGAAPTRPLCSFHVVVVARDNEASADHSAHAHLLSHIVRAEYADTVGAAPPHTQLAVMFGVRAVHECRAARRRPATPYGYALFNVDDSYDSDNRDDDDDADEPRLRIDEADDDDDDDESSDNYTRDLAEGEVERVADLPPDARRRLAELRDAPATRAATAYRVLVKYVVRKHIDVPGDADRPKLDVMWRVAAVHCAASATKHCEPARRLIPVAVQLARRAYSITPAGAVRPTYDKLVVVRAAVDPDGPLARADSVFHALVDAVPETSDVCPLVLVDHATDER